MGKGAFQELDAISLLTPHTKLAVRPSCSDPHIVADAIRRAFCACGIGRPGPAFVDLPADIIKDDVSSLGGSFFSSGSVPSPLPHPDPARLAEAAALVKRCSRPLIIIGKGAAYARAENAINRLVSSSDIPFLPTPMGKGIVPDDSNLNVSSARSTALREADLIILLGARLNWILHFGQAPNLRSDVRMIQVDICPEELVGTNSDGQPSLGIFSDVSSFAEELLVQLKGWRAFSFSNSAMSGGSSYEGRLAAAKAKNEQAAEAKGRLPTEPGAPLNYHRTFHIIKDVLNKLSPPNEGNIVYVAEGANTMDISRSIFPLHKPRRRLDAGTHATMGVGLGYCIGACAAYNWKPLESGDFGDVKNLSLAKTQSKKKKIVALEGDSAFGFSAMEIETMQRYRMPILIYVINNSGIYHGDSDDAQHWRRLQDSTTVAERESLDFSQEHNNHAGEFGSGSGSELPSPRSRNNAGSGLRSTSLSFQTRYDKLAEMVGGRGFLVRTEEELAKATVEAFHEAEKVCIVNVIVKAGVEGGKKKKIGFKWQATMGQARKGGKREEGSEGGDNGSSRNHRSESRSKL